MASLHLKYFITLILALSCGTTETIASKNLSNSVYESRSVLTGSQLKREALLSSPNTTKGSNNPSIGLRSFNGNTIVTSINFTLGASNLPFPPLSNSNDAPDTYAEVSSGTNVVTTECVRNNSNPTWPTMFTLNHVEDTEQFLTVDIKSKTVALPDMSIGMVEFDVERLMDEDEFNIKINETVDRGFLVVTVHSRNLAADNYSGLQSACLSLIFVIYNFARGF